MAYDPLVLELVRLVAVLPPDDQADIYSITRAMIYASPEQKARLIELLHADPDNWSAMLAYARTFIEDE